jgi:hypothetical protein
MEKKLTIKTDLILPLLLLCICICIPVANGSMLLFHLVRFLVLFIASFLIGFLFLDFLKSRYEIKGDVIYNLSVYLGLIFLSPLLVLQVYFERDTILAIAFLLSLAISLYFLRGRKLTVSHNFKYQGVIFLSSLVTLILFANWKEVVNTAPLMYTNYFQDFYWFTALTNSISDFNFSNSNFEAGTGIYHHILGLFPAAIIRSLTTLSSHTALWSVTMPLAVFSAYSSIVLIIEQFIQKIKPIHLLFALLTFVFHFPINPKCFLNGNICESLWFGTGHTLPVLPTWAAVYCLSILLTIVLLKSKKFNLINICVVSLLSFMLAWAKITAIVIYYPFIYLFIYFVERKLLSNRQGILLMSTLPVFLLIVLYYSHSSAKFILEPGQIIIDNLRSSNISFMNYLLAIGIGLVLVVLWIGLKFILLFHSNRVIKKIAISFLITLLLCIFFQVILKIKSFGIAGQILDDSSYDIQQFMRSVFLYIDIFAVLLFCRILSKSRTNRRVSKIFIVFSSLFTLYSITLLFCNVKFYFPNYFISKNSWNVEIVRELKEYKVTNKAMISNYEYSGQFLAAHDIDNFYLSIENRNGGYTYSYLNYLKYKDLENFIKCKKGYEYLRVLENLDVRILIATPNTLKYFKLLSERGLVSKIESSNWLFEPNYRYIHTEDKISNK